MAWCTIVWCMVCPYYVIVQVYDVRAGAIYIWGFPSLNSSDAAEEKH